LGDEARLQPGEALDQFEKWTSEPFVNGQVAVPTGGQEKSPTSSGFVS